MNMVNIRQPFIFICCLLTLLAACHRTPKFERLPNDATILAFGDSLTFGTGVEAESSYPAILEKLVKRKVVRAGVPGELSSDGLKRLPEVLDDVHPRLLILCHGGNDLLRRTGEAVAEANLRAMLKLAKERGINVILIAVPRPGLRLSPPDFYEKIAGESGAAIDTSSLSEILSDNSLKSDITHPNAQGYQRLAEAMANLLRKTNAI